MAAPSDLLLIHATGLGALALNVVALLRTCERSLRLQSAASGAIWALNNLLLGAHTAAVLSLISAGRTVTSIATLGGDARAAAKRRRLLCTAFLLVTLAASAATWSGWPSALLAAASLLSTWALFHWQGRSLRIALVAVSALWMHHAWVHDSWEQIAANALTAAAALLGTRRSGTSTAAPGAAGATATPLRSR